MIQEYLLKKVLDASFNAAKDTAKKLLAEKRSKLLTTRTQIEESLNLHLRSIKNWSGEISFSDLKKAKTTTEIFIELDLYVYPRRVRINPSERIGSIPLRNMFDETKRHVVLLGGPGAGKTTSMKFLCQLLFFDEEFLKDRFAFPILIKFRDLNNLELTFESTLIIDEIFRILGLSIILPEETQDEKKITINEIKTLKEKLVVSFLEEFNVLLILEGFDELGKHNYREKAVNEIINLSTQLEQCTFIVTTRTGEFKYRISNTDEYEICSLNSDQISSFTRKWLQDDKKANDFLRKIYRTPFADTAIRPITLAHLCAIYERIQDIPEKPKTIYKKIVNLLLEEWDQQRFVKRESRYANFEVDRKYDFLCHLAYVMTEGLQTTVFSTRDLLYVYKTIYKEYNGLKLGEATQVVSEIETHTGLFLQTGFEQFEFAHKSLQEFLTAEYLVKLPSIPSDQEELEILPNELAIAVAISSNPSIYFIELVLTRLNECKLEEDFIITFINRLLIEKPDFKTSEKLEMSFLTLLSLYNQSKALFGSELWTYAVDSTIKELEKLIKTHHSSLITYNLKYYKVSQIYQTSNNDNFHKLVLDKDAPTSLSYLPEVLYLRKSFQVQLMRNFKRPS